MFSIHQATSDDLPRLEEFVRIAKHDWPNRAFFDRTIPAGQCLLLNADGIFVGYAVLEYTFYDQGFVPILWILEQYRRKGAGELLMRHIESVCETPKLFTSTNQSNVSMQSLLAKLGYEPSGMIYNLDPGDPELVYVKMLEKGQAG
jgi:ribosomal protein S18 acetylase RimI-like enzyme